MGDLRLMTAAELLRAGAQRIRTNGWIKFTLGPAEGPNCARGAMVAHVVANVSSDLSPSRALLDTHDSVEALFKIVYTLIPPSQRGILQQLEPDIRACVGVTMWNDEMAVDGEEVAQTMEKAAALWEETNGL